jgi:hypothetical protein
VPYQDFGEDLHSNECVKKLIDNMLSDKFGVSADKIFCYQLTDNTMLSADNIMLSADKFV